MTTSGKDNDVFARAMAELRDEQDAALARATQAQGRGTLGGDPTWILIVGDVRRARWRRRWMSAVALTLGVWLTATGVWAAATGRLTAIVNLPAALFAPRTETAAPATQPRPHARPRPLAPAEGTPPPPTRVDEEAAPLADSALPAPVKSTPAAPPPVRFVRRVEPSRRLAAADLAPAPEAAPAPSDVAALYREAHALHFVRRDFTAALAAWDRYLAKGTVPLAVEARYNRAIALAHLGRAAEAVAALRPFADGGHGGYRQQEALNLIARLESR